MKPLVRVPLKPFEFVTTTFTAPAARAGVTAVIVLALTMLTFVAALPPKVMVAPDEKFVPVMFTDVPPAVVPELGETDVTVGGCCGGGGGLPDSGRIVVSFFSAPGELCKYVSGDNTI